MLRNLVAVVLLVTGATTALVAQIRYLPDAPGTWKPWTFTAYPDNRREVAAQPLEVRALEKQLLALNGIIKSTPGFAAPVGFSVETAGYLQLETYSQSTAASRAAAAKRPLPASLNFGAYGVYETAAGVRGDTGETAQLLFFVNQLELPLFGNSGNDVPEFEHIEADVVLLASPQPDLFGMPRYGDMLVLKKSAAPIWAAVPLGEALALAVRGVEARLTSSRDVVSRLQANYADLTDPAKRAKRVADIKAIAPMAKDPDYLDKMMKAEAAMAASAEKQLRGPITDAEKTVAAVERELAAAQAAAAGLSAADRAAPACYASRDRASRFKRAPADGCVPLIRPNWALFNPALPRSAPQILVISHFSGCVGDGPKPIHAGGCAANKRLLESIDREALLAWLQ